MQNKNICKYLIAFFFISCSTDFLHAQENRQKSILNGIRESYESFNYEETDKLLNLAFQHLDNFSDNERISIYKFAAFRQYQIGNQEETKNYFWKIFEIDPSFNLNQVSTSPKILAVFRQTKVAYIEKLNTKYDDFQKQFIEKNKPWRSLVFPGLEQLHRGYRTKGIVFTATAIAGWSGLIYSIIDSQLKYDQYMATTNPIEIRKKYKTYNTAYKNQFYWAYSLLAIWMGSHIDAVFFCPVSHADISTEMTTENQIIRLTFNF